MAMSSLSEPTGISFRVMLERYVARPWYLLRPLNLSPTQAQLKAKVCFFISLLATPNVLLVLSTEGGVPQKHRIDQKRERLTNTTIRDGEIQCGLALVVILLFRVLDTNSRKSIAIDRNLPESTEADISVVEWKFLGTSGSLRVAHGVPQSYRVDGTRWINSCKIRI